MKKILLLILFFSQSLYADYYRTGPVEGENCTLGVYCKWYSVDAVEGENGQLYTLSQVFPKVSSYSSSKKRCWINTSSGDSWGFLGYAFDAAFRPDFYTNKNGKLKKQSFDFITFPCVKR